MLIYSFIECNDSLLFSGASSIPLCYVPFPSTPFHQRALHPPSLNLSIYLLVCLSASLFPNSYIILFWELHFFPFSVHAQTNVIYLTLLSLLYSKTCLKRNAIVPVFFFPFSQVSVLQRVVF